MFIKSKYTIAFKASNKKSYIIFNSSSGSIAYLEDNDEIKTLKSLFKTGFSEPNSDLENTLVEEGYFVPDNIDEIAMVDKSREYYKEHSKHYELILYPTEECNFRCTYCFEDFLRGEMKSETQEAIIKHLEKVAPNLESLNIAWFGGEPLEAPNVIKYINTKAISLSKEHNFKFTSGVTTNAYNLDFELFEELVKLGITKFQITLDGTAETHDTLRILKGSGGPTFNKIINNIANFKESKLDFQVYLRSNFDKSNKDKIPELVQDLRTMLKDDKRFFMYVKPIENFGGTSAKHLPIYDVDEGFDAMYEVQKEVQTCFPTTPELSDSFVPMGSACYAAMPNSIAIGSDGTLYKCTLDLNEPLNQLGHIKSNGELEIDYSKWVLWTTSDASQDQKCTACFFKPTCQGMHCPLLSLKNNTNECSPLKKNLKKSLELVTIFAGHHA